DDEAGAALRRVLRPDLTLVLAHDAQRDRQAYACSRAGWLRREERIEDPLHEVGRNAGARILDLDADGLAAGTRTHRQAVVVTFLLLHRLLGIGDEIQEHLLQLVGIGHGFRDRLIILPAHVDTAHTKLIP